MASKRTGSRILNVLVDGQARGLDHGIFGSLNVLDLWMDGHTHTWQARGLDHGILG